MYKWSLLLLASFAVFQPIASFTERNLVDGRQQCCDHQSHLLHRDTRVDVYGPFRFNKLGSKDRRLNNQREIPETRRRYEVRSVESALSRETESPASQRVGLDHAARFSRVDRAFVRIEPHDQRSRRVSRDRFTRVSTQNDRVYRESQIRNSRDDTTRVADELQSRISMEGRREPRLLRETNSIRYITATREARELPQRTRNDLIRADMRNRRVAREAKHMDRRDYVAATESRRTRNNLVRADMRNRRVSREAEHMDRRGYVAATESRRQNVRDNNREYFALERRVQDVSENRLSLVRASSADETKDNSVIRNIDLNRRVTREAFEMERRIRLTPESRRVTDTARVARVLNVRDQTREDFRQERRVASPERRVTRTAVREERIRSEPAVRSEERQSRRIREETKEFRNNARDIIRNTVKVRRNVRSVDRSNVRDNVERRFAGRSLDRRINRVSASRSSSLSREEPINTIMNDIRRIENNREREIRDDERHERRSLNRQTREDRRTIFANIQSEDRIMARRDSRTSRPLDARSRNMEERIARVMENDRHSRSQAYKRSDAQGSSRNDERERHVEHRRHSTDRRMDQSRQENREGLAIKRQARSVESVRSEGRDTRFDNRADTRNQRSTRFDGRSDALVREPRKLEREVSRSRDYRINDERISAVKESRNREVRDTRTREVSEIRSRLALEEAARIRHDFVSKTTEPTSYALNWQYLFYTLQGIYLCGMIMKMMETSDKQKTRSWWVSTKAVKVD